jgi:hypothetical protein
MQTTQANIQLTLTPRKIPSSLITITSTSQTTYDPCDLFVKISNQNPVMAGYFIEIEIPSEIQLPSGSLVCSMACNRVGLTTTVRVEVAGGYGPGQLDRITVMNVRNPVST